MFGPYRLIALLGRGGMGEVWRAYDTRRGRTVALKRLAGDWADLPAFQERFRLEAQLTARLMSEHVVVIHDFGEIDGRLFIDMRLATGGDLADLLATQPRGLHPAQAANLCHQVADGLEAAHRGGLVHRDVKPSNVLLAPDAGGQRAFVVDFGIAKLADELTGGRLTVTGATLGTPAYMAPELYVESGTASVASDVYALGCVLFEMLTGRKVFTGPTSPALMHQHLTQPAPAPSSLRPELAPFDPVLARALAKNPEQRYPGPGALAHDAGAAAAVVARREPVDGPGTGPPPPPPGPPGARSWWRRRGVLVGAGIAAVVIAAGAVIGVAATQRSSAPPVGPSGPPPVSAPAVTGQPQQLAVALAAANGLKVSPDGARTYIADGDAHAVVVVDNRTGATLAPIRVAGDPNVIALTADGRQAYVTLTGTDRNPGNSVAVVDTAAGAVTATIPVGVEPFSVVLSPDGRRAWVTNTGTEQAPGNTVSVIDTATNAVTTTIPVGLRPRRLGISPDGAQLYVPNSVSAASTGPIVTVVDTATNATTTLSAGDTGPSAALPSPDGRRVYLICGGRKGTPGSVQALDPVTHVLTPVAVGALNVPFRGTLTPDGRTLVVANWGLDNAPDHTVTIVDTVTGATRKVTLGARPYDVAVAPDGRTVFVTTSRPSGLARFSLDTG